MTTYTHLDGAEKLVEGTSAELLEILARCTGVREDIIIIGCPVRLEKEVVTGKTQHLVAVVTFGEVEATERTLTAMVQGPV